MTSVSLLRMTILTCAATRNAVDEITAEVMRAAMGAFCSGVIVVTALGQAPDAGPLGFTGQSFASLSLDPPLISFSPARTPSTWSRIREIGRFAVNELAPDQTM